MGAATGRFFLCGCKGEEIEGPDISTCDMHADPRFAAQEEDPSEFAAGQECGFCGGKRAFACLGGAAASRVACDGQVCHMPTNGSKRAARVSSLGCCLCRRIDGPVEGAEDKTIYGSGAEWVAEMPGMPWALHLAVIKKRRDDADAREFGVSIDKTLGGPLGIHVDDQDGPWLLVDSVSGGLMGKWNASNPGLEVKPGDRIVEVNGIRGDIVALVEEGKKHKVLEMTIRR